MAINDPQALLLRLLKEPDESTWLEFKVNNCDPDLIGRWASACANAAILAGKERAFLVWGIEDKTKNLIGTTVQLNALTKGAENLTNWLSRIIQPRLMMEFLDFKHEGKQFAILVIEPTYDRPVKYRDLEYIRIGENIKELREFPEHEKALWLATSRRKFESAVALSHQSVEQVISKLSVEHYYKLKHEEVPQNHDEIIRRFVQNEFVRDDMEGGFDITNLGAILLANQLAAFPSVATKSVRIIKYLGLDKRSSSGHAELKTGYARGFSELIDYVIQGVPSEEKYISGIRKTQSVYPIIAIREIIANALIHQDLTLSGTGPVIEIYSNRIEVTNPGNSLITVDRIIDERRSRNEKFASAMRDLGLCEERGGGLDKAIIEVEERNLPPIDFISSAHSMCVVLFGPKPFSALAKDEKLRACFHHCIIRYIKRDYMSNATLRQRFSLSDDDYQAASGIIAESVKKGRIVPSDPAQGKRNARYVPYWTR